MLNIPDFRQRFGFLVFSIILNSAANALTIATSLGSAVWTGSSVNLADWTHISLGTTLLLYGVVVTILNQLLLGHFDRRRFISNLLYIVPFGPIYRLLLGLATDSRPAPVTTLDSKRAGAIRRCGRRLDLPAL